MTAKAIFRMLFGAVVLVLHDSALARSEDTEAVGSAVESGYICLGYHPENNAWGWADLPPGFSWLCPPGYAFFSITHPCCHKQPEQLLVAGNCCRLPRADILTDQHLTAVGSCPDGFVATGILWNTRGAAAPYQDPGRGFRCTRINSTRYALGQVHPGTMWGIDAASAFPWQEQKRIRRDQIPLAIRFGAARRTSAALDSGGCIGNPIGSLFVGLKARHCQGTLWAEVFEITAEGKKESLRMFPQCLSIDDLFSPEAKCLK